MIKTFCDVCGNEITQLNSSAINGKFRLNARIKREGVDYSVEVIHSTDGVANKGDVCKHCLLDALYVLDDRPTQSR